MANVTVHDAEKEWETDYRVDGRVDLFVRRNCILIYDHLEVLGELISLEERRRIKLARIELLNL